MGSNAPIAFALLYGICVVALIPASLLTIAAGAIFGLGPGVLYSFSGAVIGSTSAFLMGRYLVRGLVQRRLSSSAEFAAIDRAVSARGRRIVFLLRLSPVVPFSVLNYALGLTRISLLDFVVASVGMLPASFVYAYAGKLTGETLVLAGQAVVPRNASYYVLLVGGLVATLAAVLVITRTARVALRDV